jgi:hypothetical protein
VTNYQCYEAPSRESRPSFNWASLAPGADELTYITSLHIYVDLCLEELEQAPWVYARTPALRNLHLEAPYNTGEGECCEYGRQILGQIFGPCAPGRHRPKLKSLRISELCFMLAGDLLPKLVDLQELEHLQLEYCMDIHPFLRHLAQLRPNLSSFYLGTGYNPTVTGDQHVIINVLSSLDDWSGGRVVTQRNSKGCIASIHPSEHGFTKPRTKLQRSAM